jgi:hypothetical protein
MKNAIIKALGGVTAEEFDETVTALGGYDTLARAGYVSADEIEEERAAHLRVKAGVPGYRDGVPSINRATDA